MNVTISHPNPSFTGTITVLETVAVGFTNGVASVDIPPQAIAVFGSMPGFSYTYGAPSPAPPYDANLDVTVNAILGNGSSASAGTLRAAYLTQVAAIAGEAASATTARLNAALAAASSFGVRKVIRLVGDFTTNAPLVVPSNTVLDAQAATVTLAAASNCNMVTNYAAANPAATGSDGAITSGQAVLTTALASQAIVGQTVTVAGAISGGQQALCATITAVGSGTITLSVAAGATVSGAAVKLFTRDSNIEVIGGLWDRQNNSGPGGIGTQTHTFFLRHLDGFRLRGQSFRSAAGKYSYSIASATRGVVEQATFLSTYSDGVHLDGPCSFITIRDIFGAAGDDFVALTAEDWHQYGDVAGDITDITIENIYPNQSARAAVKVMGGPGGGCKRIRVRNVYGSVLGTGGAVWIGDDEAQPETIGGFLDDVTVENLACTVPTGYTLVQLNSRNPGRIRFSGVVYNDPASTKEIFSLTPGAATTFPDLIIENVSMLGHGSGAMIYVSSSTTVTRLLLEKWRIPNATAASVVQNLGTITNLAYSHVAATTTSGSGALLANTGVTAAVGNLRMSNVNVKGSGTGALIQTAGNADTLTRWDMVNVLSDNMAWLWDVNTVTELHMVNVTSVNPGQGIGYNRATTSLTIRGEGLAIAPGTQDLALLSGAQVRSYSLGFACRADRLTRAVGAMASNNASALSCGVGPIACDGTTWKNLATAATY